MREVGCDDANERCILGVSFQHRLFDAAFTGDVATAYRTSMAVAAERGLSVQVSLRLTAPGLAALPWETLYDPVSERYLCRKDPLVRNVPAPHVPALQVTRPLRVLGMISSPRGLVALDVELAEAPLLEQRDARLSDARVDDDLARQSSGARRRAAPIAVTRTLTHGSLRRGRAASGI